MVGNPTDVYSTPSEDCQSIHTNRHRPINNNPCTVIRSRDFPNSRHIRSSKRIHSKRRIRNRHLSKVDSVSKQCKQ